MDKMKVMSRTNKDIITLTDTLPYSTLADVAMLRLRIDDYNGNRHRCLGHWLTMIWKIYKGI